MHWRGVEGDMSITLSSPILHVPDLLKADISSQPSPRHWLTRSFSNNNLSVADLFCVPVQPSVTRYTISLVVSPRSLRQNHLTLFNYVLNKKIVTLFGAIKISNSIFVLCPTFFWRFLKGDEKWLLWGEVRTEKSSLPLNLINKYNNRPIHKIDKIRPNLGLNLYAHFLSP